MARIGRAFPQQPHLGKPLYLDPLVPTTTGQFRVRTTLVAVQHSRLRPRRAMRIRGELSVVRAATPVVTPLNPPFYYLPVDRLPRRAARLVRSTTYQLGQPILTPRPIETSFQAALARSRRSPRTFSRYAGPIVVRPVALSPPLSVNYLPVDRLPRRSARLVRQTTYQLGQPILPARPIETSFIVALASTRQRSRVFSRLAGPIVVQPAVLTLGQLTLPVTLVEIRPRATVHLLLPEPPLAQVTFTARPVGVTLTRARPTRPVHRLGQPTTLAVFSGPAAHITRARPRPTISSLGVPQVIRVPAVELAEQTVRVTTVRTRPRRTLGTLLRPPQIVRVPSVEQAEDTIRVVLTRARPRRTRTQLTPPRALLVFSGPVTPAVRARPRPTARILGEPQVVRTPSVEQAEQTIRVVVVRSRPRLTKKTLGRPVTLLVFAGAEVRLVRARPPATVRRLGAPTVLRVPSVEQQEDTIRITLARARPRPTTRRLAPPAVLRVFAGPLVRVVNSRPRLTTKQLSVPAVIEAAPVFAGPAVHVVRIRPQRTSRLLAAPTVVEQAPAEDTLRVQLTSVRPRPATSALRQPVVLDTFRAGVPAITRIRPAGVRSHLAPPEVVFEEPTTDQQTLRVTLTAVREARSPLRRGAEHVIGLLAPGTVTPPTLAQLTIAVKLASIPAVLRRRPSYMLGRPAIVAPPPPPPNEEQQQLRVEFAKVTALDVDRRAPHSELGKPTVIGPPIPPPAPTGGALAGGGGFPRIDVEALLDVIAREGIGALDDEEIAILMALGII